MDRLVFGLDQADVGKLHGAWNYIGSNSVKKRMKFKKILFHIHYIIRERIQLLNQFTSFTREKRPIFMTKWPYSWPSAIPSFDNQKDFK